MGQWILILLSVTSVYVIIERGIVLRHFGDTRAADRAPGLLGENKRREALGADAVTPALALERARFERGLGFLATVGANAPFVGLFGTVIGVVVAFHVTPR